MVGVGWPQALMTMHGASTTSWVLSWVPSWVHWRQVVVTLLVALGAGWVSLCLRYLHKGQPFGTRKAAVRATTVIVLTAVLATVLSALLPRLPPVSVGLLIPALLCADRLPKGEREPGTDQPEWYGLVTGGVSLLLNWLQDQTAMDSYRWAKGKADEGIRNLGDLMQAAEHVQETLCELTRHRAGSGRLRHELKADRDGIEAAVARARSARSTEETEKEDYSARRALITMLGRAYAWRCTGIRVMPRERV
jgi:hypothetical protein